MAARRHAAELGMTAALSARDAATRQIQARRNAIEAELRTHRDYQTVENETDQARKRLSELPEDQSLTQEQREKVGAELAAKIRRPTEMRKEFEAADSEMQQETERWHTAAKRVAELQPQLKRAIDSDPAVIKAAQEEKQIAATLEKARPAVTRAEQAVTAAQGNLERQNQRLQAAMAQSRHYR